MTVHHAPKSWVPIALGCGALFWIGLFMMIFSLQFWLGLGLAVGGVFGCTTVFLSAASGGRKDETRR